LLDLCQLLFRGTFDARPVALLRQAEQLAHIFQRKAELLRATYEPQSCNLQITVAAVAGRKARVPIPIESIPISMCAKS
jgi:hypothetical protein